MSNMPAEKGIIGRKLGMTQIFTETGNVVPVTVIEAGPCTVIQKKTPENDSYSALQLGFMEFNDKKATKPVKGHFKKANVKTMKHLKEFKFKSADGVNVGDKIGADSFKEGEKVDVTGLTKGRGYSGAIKRWGQHKQAASHGVGPIHRQAGSMGANSDPSRIMKNKHLPGQYGHEQVTILNLDVIKVDKEKNIIAVKGAVPGPKGAVVFIRNTVKPLKIAKAAPAKTGK